MVLKEQLSLNKAWRGLWAKLACIKDQRGGIRQMLKAWPCSAGAREGAHCWLTHLCAGSPTELSLP